MIINKFIGDSEILLADNDDDYNEDNSAYENLEQQSNVIPQTDATLNVLAQQQADKLQRLPGDVKNLSNEVKLLQANVETLTDATQIFGMTNAPVGYLSVAGVCLSLLLVVLIIWVKSGVRGVEMQNDFLEQRTEEDAKVISALETEIKALKNQNSDLTSRIAQLEKNAKPTTRTPLAIDTLFTTANSNKQTQLPPSPQPSPPPSLADKYADFVKDFNALSNQSGVASKSASNEFTKRYNVKKFTCTNFEARMNDPVPPAIFNAAPNGNYWAYEIEPGVFAVVPKLNNYSDNIHSAQAMGDVFQSNFVPGNIYSRVQVRKPAIFKGEWNLESQGELELSQ